MRRASRFLKDAKSLLCLSRYWITPSTSVFYVFLFLLSGSNLFAQVINPTQAGLIEGGFGVTPNLTGASAVCVQGNYAYVVGTGDVLEILDITLPGLPLHKGSIANGTGGAIIQRAQAVVVQGNYAYITSEGGNAFEIIDVSNPSNPVHKGILTDGGGQAPYLNEAWGLFVSGNYAYVASSGSNALEIIDITNPALPVHKGSLLDASGGTNLIPPYLFEVVSVFVSGNYAYVGSLKGSLEIVDISNPASPVHVGSLQDGAGVAPFLSAPYGIYVVENLAYVTDAGNNALEIIDIANPASPVHKSSLLDGGGGATPHLKYPFSVTVSGNYAFVANYAVYQDQTIISGNNRFSAFEVIDVSNPASPVHAAALTALQDGTNNNFLQSRSVVISGNTAYLTGRYGNLLSIVDVTSPVSPHFITSAVNGNGGALLGGASSVYVSGNYAYVASTDDGAFEVVDISNPSLPVHKASLKSNSSNFVGSPSSVFVLGNTAYLADKGGAVTVIDVTNPSVPSVKSQTYLNINTQFIPTSIYFDGAAYVVTGTLPNSSGGVNGQNSLLVVNPSQAPCSTCTPYFGRLDDGTSGPNGVALLNNPLSIVLAFNSQLGKNFAYIASNGSNALEIVDVSDPSAPIHYASLIDGAGGALLKAPSSVYVSGNYAYVASSGSNALEIIDITNPQSPTHAGSIIDGQGGASLSGANSVQVSGNLAYVTFTAYNGLTGESNGGLEIIDISTPTAPKHYATLRNGTGGALLDNPTSIFVSGNYAYMTNSGLYQDLDIAYLYGPSLTNFSPATGAVGTPVTITGQNFNTFLTPSISGTPSTITSVTATSLTFNVPANATVGKINLNYNGQNFTSTTNFIVTPTAAAASDVQQTSFTTNWSDVGAVAYYLDLSVDNFTTFVSGYNNFSVGNVTSFSIAGLSPAITYQYRVRSSDGSLSSDNSSAISVQTIPSTPLANDATSVGQTNFAANWTSVSGAAGYYLDVALDLGFTKFLVGYNNLLVPSTSQSVSGLNAGTTYYYRVRSTDVTGSSPSSPVASVITDPSNPVTNPATLITTAGFTANWSTVIGATGYYLDVSSDNFNTFVTGYNNLSVGSVSTYTISGLSSGVTYQYQIRASNSSGSSGNSTPASVITLPAAPNAGDANGVGQNSFTSSWTSIAGATTYSLDVAADNLFNTITYPDITVNGTSYIVNGLNPETTYYYRVRAVDQTGSSANSNIVAVTTLASQPSTQSFGISFTNVSSTSLTASFTSGSGSSHLVVISSGAPLNTLPLNQTSYSADHIFSNGTQIGNGYVVSNNASSVTVTNLSPSTTYYFKVFDFNGSGGTENYNINAASNNPASQITLATVPTSQPMNLTFSNLTASSVNGAFTAAADNPTGYLVLRANAASFSTPSNATTYSIGSAIGSSTVAYVGPALSFGDGGLPAGTVFYSIYAYNGTGSAINYFTSNPLQGSVTLDVTPPVISVPIPNPTTVTGGNTPIFNAIITDNVSVASAEIFYRGISHATFRSAALNPSGIGGNYSVQIQTDWYDSLGLEYYFMATDENGNTTAKPNITNYVQLIIPSISLPALPSGNGQTDYRIVSFPYVLSTDNNLTTVYNGVPWNDNTKAAIWWWDPTLKNGGGDYDQYGSGKDAIRTVETGKGYWVLTSTSVTPQLTNVVASKYNHSTLFSMTLKPKWNEVGNPYPVPISWDDVVALNLAINPNASFSPLNIYDGTGYKPATGSTLLKAFEGGFVKNLGSSDITILIPFPGQTSIGGRETAFNSDVSQPAWNVFLHINQKGGNTNQLGGFGMNPLAQSGADRYDNFNPPQFLEMPEVNFINSKNPGETFSRDMVKTQEEYVWQFTPLGKIGEQTLLNWNPNIMTSDGKQLFLLDEEQLKVIDMIGTSSYSFTLTSASRFRIFYGSNIENKVTTQNVAASVPYPNPLTKDASAKINLALPDDSNQYQVSMQLYNGQGDLIESSTKSLASGLHQLEFALSGQSLSSGIYIYKLAVVSEKTSAVYSGKILKP